MMIRWLDDAVSDLQSLRCYIAQDNTIAAGKVVKKILDAVEMIVDHPEIGRKGRVINTRELLVSGTPYIVPYWVKNNSVEILRVFHSSMQWPEEINDMELT